MGAGVGVGVRKGEAGLYVYSLRSGICEMQRLLQSDFRGNKDGWTKIPTIYKR